MYHDGCITVRCTQHILGCGEVWEPLQGLTASMSSPVTTDTEETACPSDDILKLMGFESSLALSHWFVEGRLISHHPILRQRLFRQNIIVLAKYDSRLSSGFQKMRMVKNACLDPTTVEFCRPFCKPDHFTHGPIMASCIWQPPLWRESSECTSSRVCRKLVNELWDLSWLWRTWLIESMFCKSCGFNNWEPLLVHICTRVLNYQQFLVWRIGLPHQSSGMQNHLATSCSKWEPFCIHVKWFNEFLLKYSVVPLFWNNFLI